MKAALEANTTISSWAVDLTAAVLVQLHPDSDHNDETKRGWIAGWKEGGWGTLGLDLGPPEAKFGPSCVTGSLLATGSDNDKNVFAKFRLPAHPVVHRASIGLAMLTDMEEDACLASLVQRGKAYRGMRDGLLKLVETPVEVEGRKGSMRERRAWEVADVLSRVLSRATALDLGKEKTCAVVPLYERLEHSVDQRGENVKLVYDEGDEDGDEGDVLIVALRDIAVGEAITRNYDNAPSLEGDTADGALRLLLQFGLPPNAWKTSKDKD